MLQKESQPTETLGVDEHNIMLSDLSVEHTLFQRVGYTHSPPGSWLVDIEPRMGCMYTTYSVDTPAVLNLILQTVDSCIEHFTNVRVIVKFFDSALSN